VSFQPRGASLPLILELDRIEAVLAPRQWAFARERAAEIEAHWRGLVAANPSLFDGRVLVQYERRVEGRVFHASYLETDYSAFIAWRDFGWPDREVLNGFAMAALRARDGAFLLGEMGPHTANAGKVYFAAGTPDPDDVTQDGRVDLLGSALRELAEETGLDES
jgi:8-oxo-dGTP pyrophosphatase MutT (NUDIX family)